MSCADVMPVLPLLGAMLLAILWPVAVNGQTKPEQITVSTNPQVAVNMVLVPAGTFSLERPSSKNGTAARGNDLLATASTAQIPPFYIGISEITFNQLVPLLEPARVAAIEARIAQTSGSDAQNQYLRDAIRSSSLPAFALSFDDVVAFCREATKQSNGQLSNEVASIESRRFRAPTHVEWQYACRAAPNVERSSSHPHLNRWVELDALPKDAREKIREEWQKAGKQLAELTGSQFQIFELIEARLGQRDALTVPQEILSSYFHEALGVNRDFAKASARLNPIEQGKPNEWGLYDMHDNVCEWVVKIDSRNDFLQWWRDIEQESGRTTLLSRPALLFAGGGFSQAANVKGAWQQFAIWGGFPIQYDSGELAPLTLQEGLDNSARSKAVDVNAGFRVVMDRTLRGDWFAIIRKASVKPNAKVLSAFRQSADEVGTAQEAVRIKSFVDAYEALDLVREGQMEDGNKRLSLALSRLSKPASDERRKSGLSALQERMAGRTSGNADVPAQVSQSEHEAFFALNAAVVD